MEELEQQVFNVVKKSIDSYIKAIKKEYPIIDENKLKSMWYGDIKGYKCSISGKNYEMQVYNMVKNCKYKNEPFNTQDEKEIGKDHDIICSIKEQKIPIEIKKHKTPDWMQCSLKYDTSMNKWVGSQKNKIPESSKKIFEGIISETVLFNGKIPPFMVKDITHADWLKLKKESDDFKDFYIDCPSTTIRDLYKEKGCMYIQISEKGIYHLGKDICNFGVPEFICEQTIRIRTKVHKKSDKKGFCVLSVTASCKPKNIKKLSKSKYSLDCVNKLPSNIIFCM